MDKKTIESNIEKFSQINNSIIKRASSVQSKEAYKESVG